MRLWTLHPQYLDTKGLVAVWREGLLAQKVLAGGTKGYTNHPQLERFRATSNPRGAIATYLRHVYAEAVSRGYNFDRAKIANRRIRGKLTVTDQQVEYEHRHLRAKLRLRDPDRYSAMPGAAAIELHPMFFAVTGAIESWERADAS